MQVSCCIGLNNFGNPQICVFKKYRFNEKKKHDFFAIENELFHSILNLFVL